MRDEIAADWNEAIELTHLIDSVSESTGQIKTLIELQKDYENNALEKLVEPDYFAHIGRVSPGKMKKVDSILNLKKIKEVFPKDLQFRWSNVPEKSTKTGNWEYLLYAVKTTKKGRVSINQKDIMQAERVYDKSSGKIVIEVAMNEKGTKKWATMTADNVGKFLAMSFNNKIYSAPRVNEVISAGATHISGSFSVEEADELVNCINANAKR